MRGADALIATLEGAGVDTVFGMPGGANLPLYDALLDSGIRHVLMRHEAGAGHAAEGYARATGRVGVAFATSGPGATNLVTPICDAQMDSVPTVFVTGQVRTALRGTSAFQEADVIGITAPIVKHSIAVERPDDVAQAIADALHLAMRRPPGACAGRRPRGRGEGRCASGGSRAAAARLPAADEAERQAGADRGPGARRRLPTGAVRRRRRYPRRGGGGADRARPSHRSAGDDDADGARHLPGERPAVAGHARHARQFRGLAVGCGTVAARLEAETECRGG